jgi:hypothetical protein
MSRRDLFGERDSEAEQETQGGATRITLQSSIRRGKGGRKRKWSILLVFLSIWGGCFALTLIPTSGLGTGGKGSQGQAGMGGGPSRTNPHTMSMTTSGKLYGAMGPGGTCMGTSGSVKMMLAFVLGWDDSITKVDVDGKWLADTQDQLCDDHYSWDTSTLGIAHQVFDVLNWPAGILNANGHAKPILLRPLKDFDPALIQARQNQAQGTPTPTPSPQGHMWGGMGPNGSCLATSGSIPQMLTMDFGWDQATVAAALNGKWQGDTKDQLCNDHYLWEVPVDLPAEQVVQMLHWPNDLLNPHHQIDTVALQAASQFDPATSQTHSTTVDLNPLDILANLWNGFVQGIIDLFHQFLGWISTFGFVWITPAALSYQNPVILAGSTWTLGAMNGFVAFLLVVTAYQSMVGNYLDVSTGTIVGGALRVILATVAADLGFVFLLPQVIELSNTMSLGVLSALFPSSFGDFSSVLSAVFNGVSAGPAFILFLVVEFIGFVVLFFIQAVRLALLDVVILFAPWGILTLSNEYTRGFGRFWATTFFCTLFVQPLQTGAMGLGAALVANFAHVNTSDPAICNQFVGTAHTHCFTQLGNASLSASFSPIALVIGVACIYIACKLPQMLWSNALKNSAGTINRDAISVATKALGGALLYQKLSA